MLEGGRNSLLESAQEATLMSVATAAFPRQYNRLAAIAWWAAQSRQIHIRWLD